MISAYMAIKILIVDDEKVLADTLSKAMEREGYEVFKAYSGNAGLEIFKANPDISLIFSDVRMDGGTGMDLLSGIRNTNPDIPVIVFFTGHTSESLEDAYDAGVDDVLNKPFDRKSMLNILKQQLKIKEQLWSIKPEKFDSLHKILIPVAAIQDFGASKNLHIGRNGFFTTVLNSSMMENDFVQFEITESSSGRKLVGAGIIKWIRANPDGQNVAGAGILFQYLDPSSREFFASLKNLKSGIPKGLNS